MLSALLRHPSSLRLPMLVMLRQADFKSATTPARVFRHGPWGEAKCFSMYMLEPVTTEIVKRNRETWQEAWIPADGMYHTIGDEDDAALQRAFAWIHLDAMQNGAYRPGMRTNEEIVERATFAYESIIEAARESPSQYLSYAVQCKEDLGLFLTPPLPTEEIRHALSALQKKFEAVIAATSTREFSC
ncbi:MAG: hypothetical protein NTV32_10195 [Gammaproteobacteria bacterium]|nr:hypothetical protein [Gammaproteobacteria bacterium]